MHQRFRFAVVLGWALLTLLAVPAVAEEKPVLTLPDVTLPMIPGTVGWIGLGGLRLFVQPKHRALCRMLYDRKVEQARPLLRAAYQASPDAHDLYVAMVQADDSFRVRQWRTLSLLRKPDLEARFRRGVVARYHLYDFRSTRITDEQYAALYSLAEQDLRAVFENTHDMMAGAVLLDLYGKQSEDGGVRFSLEFCGR